MRRPPILAAKYVLIRLLGRGAMGAVYEAVQAETGVRVAVKVLRVVDKKNAGVLVARFEREAVAIRTIVSGHVPRILEAGRDPETGIEYIAMEFLRGDGLDKILDRTDGISTDLALRIAAQTCAGLVSAHEAGVIHRDIKPHNVFLAAAGPEVVVKILDFGVAKLKMENFRMMPDDLTDTGGILGSPRYMAPEQARGAKSIDHRADLWSLGVVMYELMAGMVPHAECRSIGNLMVAICSTTPKPLRERVQWVSPEYERIVDRALQIDLNARYPSARAMLEDLDRLLPKGRIITPEMVVSADSLPTNVLTRPEIKSVPTARSLPSIFESTATGMTIRDDRASSDDLATQVMDWAKKHKSGQAAESSDGEDDFPTEVMSFDEFPTAVLEANPPPQRVPRPKRLQLVEEEPSTERRLPLGERSATPQASASGQFRRPGSQQPMSDTPVVAPASGQPQSEHPPPGPSSPKPQLSVSLYQPQVPAQPPQPQYPQVAPQFALQAQQAQPIPGHSAPSRLAAAMPANPDPALGDPMAPIPVKSWLWWALLVMLAAAGFGAWVGWKLFVGHLQPLTPAPNVVMMG
jgi:serine/threonine protein kinase